MKIIGTIAYYLVFAGVITLAVILLVPALPFDHGIETKVVLSGSMEPALPVGSVIVIRDVESYQEGDIVTFGPDNATQIPTTHRIIASRVQSGTTYFTTKGDANSDPDVRQITAADIEGKTLFHIPYLGYVIDFAKTPLGFALLIIVPALIIVFDEIRKIYMEVRRIRKRKQV